jgi:AAA ATPase domain
MRRAGARALGGGRRRTALAAPPRSDLLLEREVGVSVLAEALDAVRASTEGRLMLVAGESGVGKTMLLRRFCQLQAESVRILWGACEPLLAPRPLGPFVDVADAIGGELEELVGGAARPHLVASCVATASRSSCSRTCTGLMRRRSTCWLCSPPGSALLRR